VYWIFEPQIVQVLFRSLVALVKYFQTSDILAMSKMFK
jgi:hypothetical protein